MTLKINSVLLNWHKGRKKRTLKKFVVIGTSSIKIRLSEPERTEIEAMDEQWSTEGGEYLPMSYLLDGWIKVLQASKYVFLKGNVPKLKPWMRWPSTRSLKIVY